MNCEQYLELISARLDGELTAQEEAALTAHLQECPACRVMANDMQTLHSVLTHPGEVDAPPALSQTVMNKIKAERLASRRRFIRRISGLAACLVLCMGAWHLIHPETPAVNPNLPSIARHSDPIPPQPAVVSNQQRLRLSAMVTSFAPSADLLGNAEDFSRFIARFPYDDLSNLAQAYDEEYFHTHRLLAVVVQEPSSSISHTISSLNETSVTVQRTVPPAGDCDMALWLILAEVEGAGLEMPLTVELLTN